MRNKVTGVVARDTQEVEVEVEVTTPTGVVTAGSRTPVGAAAGPGAAGPGALPARSGPLPKGNGVGAPSASADLAKRTMRALRLGDGPAKLALLTELGQSFPFAAEQASQLRALLDAGDGNHVSDSAPDTVALSDDDSRNNNNNNGGGR